MIVGPANWRDIGVSITLAQIEVAMQQAVADVPCDCLSFSGGLDSSLLLYFMLEAGKQARVFTITSSDNHPDIHYSRLALRYFEDKYGIQIESSWRVAHNITGDNLVKVFYQGELGQHTDSIIAGDGIDEFMAGYYTHQCCPTEETYYRYLRCLQEDHLCPLNENSGNIKVYLPYLDVRVTSLLAQIPLSEKVDKHSRKKIMVELAKGKLPSEIIKRRKYGFGTIP